MKKIYLLGLVLILLILSGCYNYSSGSQYGKLLGISFFDEEGTEILGEYYNYFEYYDEFNNDSLLALSHQIKPLNSTAPVELYYCASVATGSTVTVRLTIEPKNNYLFSSLSINSQKMEEDAFTKIETIDDYLYLEYVCMDLNTENNLFRITDLIMKKEISGKMYYKPGSQWVEGRTYYSGFYFEIRE
ncbi:MAG: hypothetical protein AB7T03_04730 [Bacilli bacterium]